MPYANVIQLTRLGGPPSLPEAQVQLWDLFSQIRPSGDLEWREEEIDSTTRPWQPDGTAFSVVRGPGPSSPARSIGLSVASASGPQDGLLFRTGGHDALPPGAPQDPNGFIELYLLDAPPILEADLASAVPQLPMSIQTRLVKLGPITSTIETTIVSAVPTITSGAITLEARGTVAARNVLSTLSFNYSIDLQLGPSRSVRDTERTVEISTTGPGTLSFTGSGPVGDIQAALLNALREWADDQFRPIVRTMIERSVNAGARAQVANLLGAPVPGQLPAGVILSSHRVSAGTMQGIRAIRVIACIGCFGPLSARFSEGATVGRACAMRSLALLPATQLDLAAFRRFRDGLLRDPESGGRLVELYYAHSAELSALLLSRPRLARDAIALLVETQSVLARGSMPSGLLARGCALGEAVAPRASASLRAALQQAKEEAAALVMRPA